MSAEKDIIAIAVSDTHGCLPPEALRVMAGADFIFHAGDIGTREIIDQLMEIAPVFAVRGNMDRHSWADALPGMEAVEIGTHTVCIVHDLQSADADFKAMRASLVLHGHTHQPSIRTHRGILFVNPGSISQPRSDSGPTLARIHFGCTIRAEIVKLNLPE